MAVEGAFMYLFPWLVNSDLVTQYKLTSTPPPILASLENFQSQEWVQLVCDAGQWTYNQLLAVENVENISIFIIPGNIRPYLYQKTQ